MSKERFKLIPAVFLVLKGADGRVLLSQRFNTGFRDGDYSLAAGHVEQNETATDAMIREAKEEIGVVLVRENLHMNYIMHFGGASSGYCANFFFFVAEKWEGEITNMEPEKCSDLSWFPIDALPENTIPYVRHALECVQKGITYSEFGWE